MENQALKTQAPEWNPLSAETLSRYYPAVMATEPAGTVSDRYCFIPTLRVIEQFDRVGWAPVHVKVGNPRDEQRAGFQKHIVRFRQPGSLPNAQGLYPEIVLINSHDAGSAFILKAGIFRLVCSNGMVVGDTFFTSPRVTHVGYRDQLVLDAIATVSDILPKTLEKPAQWGAIDMTPDDRGVYGINALVRKYGAYAVGQRDFVVEQLLTPTRSADQGNDLWKTFNIAQEKLIERSVSFERRVNDNWRNRSRISRGIAPRAAWTPSRPVTGPTQNVALNASLWALTDETEKRVSTEGHRPEGTLERLQGALRRASEEVKPLVESKTLPEGKTADKMTAEVAAKILAGNF